MFATVLHPTSLSIILDKYKMVNVVREYVQQRLAIQVVGRENNLEEHLLVHSDELLVPFADIRCPLAGIIVVRGVGCW